jgi:hypothetical protein
MITFGNLRFLGKLEINGMFQGNYGTFYTLNT